MQSAAKILPFRVRRGSLFLAHGVVEPGRPAWYYLRVMPQRAPLLLKAMQSAQIDFAQYGDILASGYGETPPEGMTEQILAEHG